MIGISLRRTVAAAFLLLALLAAFTRPLTARAAAPEGVLDSRAWELVTHTGEGGGEVALPTEQMAAAFQASAPGGSIAFGSASSFADPVGAAPLSQYVASRTAVNWGSANITPPQLSGTYSGGAYQLFSTDLSRAILENGWRCRDGDKECPAENVPLGPGAPPEYRNLYLREGGTYTPLLTTTNTPMLSVSAVNFHLSLAGADPELHHVVISTCAALTTGVTEIPGLKGCDPAEQNLYEWNAGSLQPLNFLPGLTQTTPGATLAAPTSAISTDGSRVYWTEAGNLYLREAGETFQVDLAQGGGGTFQAASADGRYAFFTAPVLASEHLFRYDAVSHSATDLTPGGEVEGVLAASADGSYVYYLTASGLFVAHNGISTKAANSADSSNLPVGEGTARVSSDGSRLAFLSSAELTNFKNAGNTELYLYDAPSGKLLCVSCNPSGAKPLGPSSIPAARSFGAGPLAYQPRSLSADGTRLLFDSSDKLTTVDTDNGPDVYEWEAQGTGGCAKVAGCLGLISNGRTGSAGFLDASADATDVYFLTTIPLLPADQGGLDLYDARSGGGYPEPPPVTPCDGDECQGPPVGPEDPTPATALFEGPANPPVHYPRVKKRHHKKHSSPKHRRTGHNRKGHGR